MVNCSITLLLCSKEVESVMKVIYDLMFAVKNEMISN